MSRLMRVAFVVMLSMGVVQAQAPNVTGNWQGTLQAGKELRIVFVIANADGGGLRATMHSIDQGGQGIPANTVTLQGSTLRISVLRHQRKLRGNGQSRRAIHHRQLVAGCRVALIDAEKSHGRHRVGDSGSAEADGR
jgi:hypothetical protein